MARIGEKIRDRRKELKLSADEVVKFIGIDRSTLYRYETGYTPKIPIEVITKLAQVLDLPIEQLLGHDPKPLKEFPPRFKNIHPISTQKIPLLGEIACGQPIYASEDKETYVLAGTKIKADFCLKAKGDSMINARIHDGDIVFVRKQPAVDNGEIAVVLIEDEATLKRVYYYPEQERIILQAENPAYPPLIYSGKELDDVYILGKAIGFQSDIK